MRLFINIPKYRPHFSLRIYLASSLMFANELVYGLGQGHKLTPCNLAFLSLGYLYFFVLFRISLLRISSRRGWLDRKPEFSVKH